MKRFGFNINLKNSPEQILELGEKFLGTGEYQAIEVTYYENMQDVDTFAYNQEIRKIVADYKPQVVVHISGFNASEENSTLRSAIIHEFINCCKYVKNLGGNEIVMHCGLFDTAIHVPLIGPDGGRPTKEQIFKRSWDLSVQMLRTCCDIAKEYGIMIYTENLNGNALILRCEPLVDFVKEINRDNIQIVFDIGHCHQTGGDIVSEVLTCGSLLHHLHLHDNMSDGDSHLPVGEGDIDYKSFCDALEQVGYTGIYMLELYRCTTENLASSKERLLKCLN